MSASMSVPILVVSTKNGAFNSSVCAMVCLQCVGNPMHPQNTAPALLLRRRTIFLQWHPGHTGAGVSGACDDAVVVPGGI
eukprot:12930391-Prorocentrum_lima.AAC.1